MKKISVIILITGFLVACSGNKEKIKGNTESTTATTTNAGSEDEAIKKWLEQKEWTAENAGAPIGKMKLFADGRIEYSTSQNDRWSFSDGSLGLHLGGGRKPTVTW